MRWLRLHFKFRLCAASLIRFNFQLRFYRQNEEIIVDNESYGAKTFQTSEKKTRNAIFINTRNFVAVCLRINWTGSSKPNVNIIAHSTKINLAAPMDIAAKMPLNL